MGFRQQQSRLISVVQTAKEVIIGSDGSDSLSFGMPKNAHSLICAEICFVPEGAISDADIDLTLTFGKEGEPENQHEISDTTSVYSSSASIVNVVDLTALLSQLEAGDLGRISIDQTSVGCNVRWFGMRICYV